MKYLFFILAFSLLACGSSESLSKDEGPLLHYNKSAKLGQVLDEAALQNKVVFVDIYADWCLPCKVMDKEVFEDKATADFLKDNFITYKVNGERGEGPDLNILYKVEGYPTLLFLDSKGRVLERNIGAMGIVAFNVMADRVLAESKVN